MPDTKPLEDYNKSLETLNKTWTAIRENVTNFVLPGTTAVLDKINKELGKDIELVETLAAAYRKFFGIKAAAEEPAPTKPPATTAGVGTGPGGMETDAEYFARTGFHYGARPGETAMRRPITRAEEIPIGGFDPSRPAPAVPPVPERKPEADIAAEAQAAATKTESAWSESTNQISRDLNALGDVFTTLWNGVKTQAQEAANVTADAADKAVQAAQRAATAVKELATSGGGQDFTGFASGGYVSGPGTERSDSILARLSNGEFVVNAKSVQRLGLKTLQRINRFAGGGYAGYDYPIEQYDYPIEQYDYPINVPDYGPGSRAGPSLTTRVQVQRVRAVLARFSAELRKLKIDGFADGGLVGFADGGLVRPPPPRFAEGGLVAATASSGRPVHLHLGGQSYALSGSDGVVDALVSHANAQQMRSAGVKPPLFAGRPGGR